VATWWTRAQIHQVATTAPLPVEFGFSFWKIVNFPFHLKKAGSLMVEPYTPFDRPEQATIPDSEVETERIFLDRLLSDVRFVLSHSRSLNENLQQFAQATVLNLSAAFCRIWLLDESGQELRLVASAGMYTKVDGSHSYIPLGKLKIGTIAKNRQPHFTNSVIGDPMVENQEWAKREGMVSFAGYPLIAQEKLIGVIGIFARYPLTNAVLTTLSIVADSIAWNIERVQTSQQLEERVARRTEQLTTLLEISHNIASTIELEPLLVLILEQIKKIADYNCACFNILERDTLQVLDSLSSGGKLPVACQPELCLPTDTVDEIWRQVGQGQTLNVGDVWDGGSHSIISFEKHGPEKLKQNLGHIRALLAVPLEVKNQVCGMLILGYSQASYYTGERVELIAWIARQVALALINARLYQKAHEAAADEERQRLGRDLHDSVTQSLYSLTLLIEAGRRRLQNEKVDRFEDLFDTLSETAWKSLREVRLLAYQLRPIELEQEGLAAALRLRLEAVEKRSGIEPCLVLKGDLMSLPLVWEENLYGITVEALNNVLKHSQAKAVTVRLKVTSKSVTLEINDKGKGFNPGQSKESGGLGITSMQQRAALIGGNLTTSSSPGKGTTVKVIIKIPEPIPSK
jgi:signal transduction histidine kinase